MKTGVRQGCLVSPFLFLLAIDWIMKTTTTGRNNGIQWTLWTQLDDLDFADDLALLSHNHSQMQDKTTLLETTSAGTGIKINRKKTELMKMNTTANAPITVGGEPIREVESFVYLGSVVDQQGGTDRDVTAIIGKARAAFVMLKNIWASGEITMRTKLRIFNSNVKSVLLYRCETWRTAQTMQRKIQTFFNTCVRRIYKIIIIIIIIAFKGAIRDFLQSPHSAANRLQHARSSGPGAIVCKSCATHRALITCNMSCYVPLGTKGQLSY